MKLFTYNYFLYSLLSDEYYFYKKRNNIGDNNKKLTIEQLKEDYPQFEINTENLKLYMALSNMFMGKAVYDRTNTLNNVFEVYNNSPIPLNINKKHTFTNICDKTATGFISLNKVINILWSGGIDSTIILISLLKNKISKDQLVILCSENTIYEYPVMYYKLLKDGYNIKIMNYDYYNTPIKNNEIYLNGELGDQIFGAEALTRFSTKHLISSYKTRYFYDNPNSDFYKLEPILNRFNVNNIMEFYMTCSFVFAWYGTKRRRFYNYYKNNILIDETQNISFFDNEDFQIWSLNSSFDEKFKDYKIYKYAGKRYIFDYNKDEDYFFNKKKINSGINPFNSDWKFIDMNKNIH